MSLLRPKFIAFIFVATIFLLIFWPTNNRDKCKNQPNILPSNPPPPNDDLPGPVNDAIKTKVLTDVKGEQKEYLNAKGYITYLYTLRKQHQTAIEALT